VLGPESIRPGLRDDRGGPSKAAMHRPWPTPALDAPTRPLGADGTVTTGPLSPSRAGGRNYTGTRTAIVVKPWCVKRRQPLHARSGAMLRPLLSSETTLMVVLIAVKADSLKSQTTAQ
jgi:hypothetical protein